MEIEQITAVAQRVLDQLETRERTDGSRYIVFKDDSPEWMRDMARETAHPGGMLPNDESYKFFAEALERITEYEDMDDAASEISADYLHSRLLEWVGSHAYRTAYVDDALQQAVDNREKDITFFELLQRAQWEEKSEIFHNVLSWIENNEDVLEEEEEETVS